MGCGMRIHLLTFEFRTFLSFVVGLRLSDRERERVGEKIGFSRMKREVPSKLFKTLWFNGNENSHHPSSWRSSLHSALTPGSLQQFTRFYCPRRKLICGWGIKAAEDAFTEWRCCGSIDSLSISLWYYFLPRNMMSWKLYLEYESRLISSSAKNFHVIFTFITSSHCGSGIFCHTFCSLLELCSIRWWLAALHSIRL